MWSLYEDEKELKPLVFSNGKTQEDIVKEVSDAIEQGYKIIFIKGSCGSGKSAMALNLARKFGKTSVVVPIKSLQEQYIKDYSEKKYILKEKKFKIEGYPELDKHPVLENSELLNKKEKLKICSIVGRKNFKCRFLEENKIEFKKQEEEDSKLSDFSSEKTESRKSSKKDESCDNDFIPCKIEIKEKNLPILKDYIGLNPEIQITDFDSIKEIKRMTIAPVCPYWSPIVPEELEIKKFRDSKKIKYKGLNNRSFVINYRKNGCKYYEQYKAYAEADVIIFNSLKYKIENLMYRKPETEIEIIDECDEFLDSLANEEQINLNKLLYSLNNFFHKSEDSKMAIDLLRDTLNAIKIKYKDFEVHDEIFELKGSLIEELLHTILTNSDLVSEIEEDSSYIFHLDEVARIFSDFFDETFFSVEKRENNLLINLVTINLKKRLKELIEKNKIFIFMSGTIHSESVLKNIFGLDNFKIIEAETKLPGELIRCRYGFEIDCRYANFQSNKVTREEYLKALSKSIKCAKPPVLVHVNSFSDLPNEAEKQKYNLDNLITREELIEEQSKDPFGKRIIDFKNKKTRVLFTTKCSRGIDFPGDLCNSIIITRFPYPNISSIFWKILKKTNPGNFMSFYMDKARRELLQRIYRGLRSNDDKLYLLSPDVRVLEFNFK